MRSVADGVTTAYLDLAQIGHLRQAPADDRRAVALTAANLASFWQRFSRAGAKRLVLSGDVATERDLQAYRGALGVTGMTVAALMAGPDALRQRIAMRAEGLGPPLPGDVLRGAPSAEVDAVAARAVEHADAIRRSGVATDLIETDELSISGVADRVLGSAFH
jgi:hypothetical protein